MANTQQPEETQDQPVQKVNPAVILKTERSGGYGAKDSKSIVPGQPVTRTADFGQGGRVPR